MQHLPLTLRADHLFVEIDSALWLLDTGAPTSFGAALQICQRDFLPAPSYMGLTPGALSKTLGVNCHGLLGADILNQFDILLEPHLERIGLSEEEITHTGTPVRLDFFMGIPIVNATIQGKTHRMFFDTGAQVSYLQDDALAGFPPAGTLKDFYPGFGSFETDTHLVPLALESLEFTLRCGRLPGLLGASLMMANTTGIIGHAILENRPAAYLPRRNLLIC